MQLVASRPRTRCDAIREAEAVAICPPWHLRGMANFKEHPTGDTCDSCERDIAANRVWPATVRLCLYCGMAWGFVPMVEVEPTPGNEGAAFRLYRRDERDIMVHP